MGCARAALLRYRDGPLPAQSPYYRYFLVILEGGEAVRLRATGEYSKMPGVSENEEARNKVEVTRGRD